MRIGIESLPEAAAGMLPGRIYCVASEHPERLRQLAAETLLCNQSVGLVSDQEARDYLEHKALAKWRQRGIPSLRLSLRNRPASRRRTERLLAELDHFRFNRLDLLVLDPSEGILNLHDAQQTREHLLAYRDWAERHECTLLLIYPELLAQPACLQQLLAHADHFAGIARISFGQGELLWSSQHWFSHAGIQGQQDFVLRDQGNQLIAQQTVRTEIPANSAVALDEDIVYATMDSVEDAPELPRRWRTFTSLQDLLHATEAAMGATVVLDYGMQSDFDETARLIQQLRLRNGNALKLVVREHSAVMRHYHEQLLIQLGCNLVIPSSVGFTRFIGLLDSLSGQTFNRPVPHDYDMVVKSVAPSIKSGYLPLAEFTDAARQSLDDTQHADIDCAMLQLSVLPGVTPLDALREFRLKRAGDICSAGNDHLYLFLFACRETDIPVALKHVLSLPVNELFIDQVRHIEREAIHAQLQRLQQIAAREDIPDHTRELVNTEQPAEAAPRQQSDGAKPGGLSNSTAPVDAVPSPLRLLEA